MHLVQFPHKPFYDSRSGLRLKWPVSVVQAIGVLSEHEIAHIIDVAQFWWQKQCKALNEFNFCGIIRYDFVTNAEDKSFAVETSAHKKSAVHHLGEQHIVGMYETNGRSPEDYAAYQALFHFNPHARIFMPGYIERFVNVLRKVFGNEKIVIVVGEKNCMVKQHWGNYHIETLQRAGLNLQKMTCEEVKKSQPDNLWLWADIRKQGHSEVPGWFIDWIFEYNSKSNKIIFNSLPVKHDLFSKEHLLRRGDDRWNHLVGNNMYLNNEKSFETAVKQKNGFVIKPLNGSSGVGVVCGKQKNGFIWRKLVKQAYREQKYGLFEARFLPEFSIKGLGTYAFDINPTFFASGTTLEYISTIIRVNTARRYQKHLANNVSQGAALLSGVTEQSLARVLALMKQL